MMEHQIRHHGIPVGPGQGLKKISRLPSATTIETLRLLLKIQSGHCAQSGQLPGQIPAPRSQLDQRPSLELTKNPALVPHQKIDQSQIPPTAQGFRIIPGQGI